MADCTPQKREDLARAYDRYGVMLYRVCIVILCNKEDAEDAVQDTFAAYLKKKPVFQGPEHEKAWFLRVAVNKSRDKRRSAFFRRRVCLDDVEAFAQTGERLYVMERLMNLPDTYKAAMVLHYVEGYKVRETAQILGKSETAVKAALSRGRQMLKIELQEELSQ